MKKELLRFSMFSALMLVLFGSGAACDDDNDKPPPPPPPECTVDMTTPTQIGGIFTQTSGASVSAEAVVADQADLFSYQVNNNCE